MNCASIRAHLHPYLDDELPLERNLAILEHLNACPACAQRFEAEQQIRDRFRIALGKGESAPDSLHETLREVTSPRPVIPMRTRPSLVAIAAGLVLATVLVLEVRHQRSDGAPNTGRRASLDEPTPTAPQPLPRMQEVAYDASGRRPPAVALSQMLVEVLGADPAVPNALSMDGGPPVRSFLPIFEASPLLQSWLDRLGDRSLVVFRVDSSLLSTLNLGAISEAHHVRDASLVVRHCDGENLLIVQRSEDVFLVVSSSHRLVQLAEVLSSH